MTKPAAPTNAGAFLQLVEYRTDHPEQVGLVVEEWVQAIGARRTARYYIIGADRDRARTYVQLVEFPSYEAAMANSEHPATARFAAALSDICTDDVSFRNFDVLACEAL